MEVRKLGNNLTRAAKTAFAAMLGLFFFIGCSVDGPKSRYLLAEKLWNDADYAAAVDEFDKVTQKEPKGTLGLRALFRSAMTQTLFLSRHSDAIRKFKTYIELSSDAATVWESQKQIGEILFVKTEQYDQVINHYRTLLRIKPEAQEAPEFLFRIARAQFFLWLFEDAIATYDEILNRYPQAPWAEKAAYEIGVTNYIRGERNDTANKEEKGHYQRAILSFQEFIRRFPKSELIPQAQFGIASCLEEQDQLDAAYRQYEALKLTYPSPGVIAVKLERIRERRLQRSR